MSAVLRTTRTSFGVAARAAAVEQPEGDGARLGDDPVGPEEAGEHVGVAGGVEHGGPRPARAATGRTTAATASSAWAPSVGQPAGVAGRHDDQGVLGHPHRDRPLRPRLVVGGAERLLVGAVARDVPAAGALAPSAARSGRRSASGRSRAARYVTVMPGLYTSVRLPEVRADRVRDRVPAERGRQVERPLVLAERSWRRFVNSCCSQRDDGRLRRVHRGQPCGRVAVLERRLPGGEDREHGGPRSLVLRVRTRPVSGTVGQAERVRGCRGGGGGRARRGADRGDGHPGHRERGHDDRGDNGQHGAGVDASAAAAAAGQSGRGARAARSSVRPRARDRRRRRPPDAWRSVAVLHPFPHAAPPRPRKVSHHRAPSERFRAITAQ